MLKLFFAKSLTLLLLFSLSLSAKSQAAADNDFSDVYAKFKQLGLPDVKDSTYVKLTLFTQQQLAKIMSMGFDVNTSGNAWMLPAAKEDAPPQFIINNSTLITAYDFNKNQQMVTQSGQSKVMSGTWQKADLNADIERVIQYLQQKKEQTATWQHRLNRKTAGQLFLFAIHANQKGHKREAATIISLLYQLSSSPQAAINPAINELANGQYQNIFIDFSQGKLTWQQYREALQALCKKYPANWDSREAVNKLITFISERLKQKTPPPLANKQLTKEQQKFAEQLATFDKTKLATSHSFHSPKNSLWVLTPPKLTAGNQDDIIAQIKSQGKKSIPMLITMLNDHYLTNLFMSDLKGNVIVWSNKAPGENELFNSMSRPATRGDIARALLGQLLISDQYSNQWIWQLSEDQLIANCQLWQETLQDQDNDEIALLYLEEGTAIQKYAAINYILDHSTISERDPALEEVFLAAISPHSNRDLIIKYVKALGPKAKPFIDDFEQALLTSKTHKIQFKNPKTAETYHKQQKKQIDKTIQHLKSLLAKPATKEAEK